MFKNVGCIFRCAGCLVIVLLLITGLFAGCYYLVKSISGPIVMPVDGQTVLKSRAKGIVNNFVSEVEKKFSVNILGFKKTVKIKISEETLAAMILLAWDQDKWAATMFEKTFNVPKPSVASVWVKITDKGFNTILKLQYETYFWESKPASFLSLSVELFLRNGKLVPRVNSMTLGKMELPVTVFSRFTNYLEKKCFLAINDPDLWQGGHISDLELADGYIILYRAGTLYEIERKIN